MIERLFTIGVYGKTETYFFDQLREARIQTFCDIRRRRGVRGSQYAFVNSTYLQHALASRGIRYKYFQQLSPSNELRKAQRESDAGQHILKRDRQQLGEDFKRGYLREVLDHFDSRGFAEAFEPDASRVVVFCVEANPAACHRSLLADRLARDLGLAVEHL
jgi:uncharacterized protein (DUF488 family)